MLTLFHLFQILGNVNTLVGSAKTAVGDATGIASLSQSGNEQQAMGNAEHKAATAQGYAEGTADRISGKIDRVAGALTGDKEKEAAGLAEEEKGKAQQGSSSLPLFCPFSTDLSLCSSQPVDLGSE